MSASVFEFVPQPATAAVTLQPFRPLDLSSAGVAPSVIPRSDANAPSRLKGAALAPNQTTLAEVLFSNRAQLKVQISEVAMHLRAAQRADIFAQIDALLNPDDWIETDSLISVSSFRTFLRFLTYYHNVKRPSLVVTEAGNVAAAWFAMGHRLTVEFLPLDAIRLVLYRALVDLKTSETTAYQGHISRIPAITAAFDADSWYRNSE